MASRPRIACPICGRPTPLTRIDGAPGGDYRIGGHKRALFDATPCPGSGAHVDRDGEGAPA